MTRGLSAPPLLQLVVQLARCAPAAVVLALVLTVMRSVATAAYAIGLSRLVVQDGARDPVSGAVLVTLAAWATAQMADRARGVVVPRMQNAWTLSLMSRLLGEVTDDNREIPSPSQLTAMEAVLDSIRSWMSLGAIGALWHALDSRLIGLVGVALIWTWSPILAVAVGAAQLAASAAFTRYLDTVHKDLAGKDSIERRSARYYRDLMLRRESAKEVRIFGLTSWLLQCYRQVWSDGIRIVWQRRARSARRSFVALGLVTAAVAATVSLLTVAVLRGSATGQDVTVVVQGLALSIGLGMLGDTLVRVRRAVQVQVQVDAVVKQAQAQAQASPIRTSEPNGTAVSIEGVTFGYQRGTYILRCLDLSIAEGEKVAIVGSNGAGKSTLVRLIAGLETPASGRVLVGGTDAHLLPATARPAVVFQSFAHLPVSAERNIMLGHHDPVSLSQAAQAAGAEALLRKATDVGIGEDGLPALSGGQWQRIALARAFAATERGAGPLILDEPTSALDARVEHALYERVFSYESKATTILITHRLASVRHADRIVVLAHGSVAESGTHDELMAAGGIYAEMFEIQARRYRQEAPTDV